MGDLARAVETCEAGLSEFEAADLYELKAGFLGASKRLQECIDAVNEAAAKGLRTAGLLKAKVHALAEMGCFQEARSELKSILKETPDDLDAICMDALCLCKTGEVGSGLERIEQAIEMDPDRARTWYARALIHYELGMPDEMLRSLRKAVGMALSLVAEAKRDRDFERYWDMPELRGVLGL